MMAWWDTAGDRNQLHTAQRARDTTQEKGPCPDTGEHGEESQIGHKERARLETEGKGRSQTCRDGIKTQTKTRHPTLSPDSGTRLGTWDTDPRPPLSPGQKNEAAKQALSCLHPAR